MQTVNNNSFYNNSNRVTLLSHHKNSVLLSPYYNNMYHTKQIYILYKKIHILILENLNSVRLMMYRKMYIPNYFIFIFCKINGDIECRGNEWRVACISVPDALNYMHI